MNKLKEIQKYIPEEYQETGQIIHVNNRFGAREMLIAALLILLGFNILTLVGKDIAFLLDFSEILFIAYLVGHVVWKAYRNFPAMVFAGIAAAAVLCYPEIHQKSQQFTSDLVSAMTGISGVASLIVTSLVIGFLVKKG